MATLQQIVKESGNVAKKSFPFQYVNISGVHTFNGPNTLVLEGDLSEVEKLGKPIWVVAQEIFKPDGRFHAIVKANKEVRIRLHSNQLGFFSDQIGTYATGAFNVDTSAPLFTNPFGDNASSMDITLRGGSMIAVAAGDTGDRGFWDTKNTPFHLETEQRDITQPQDRLRDSSVMLSLTAPNGDYTDLETYTLIWNQHTEDMWITILSYGDAPNGGFDSGLTDWSTINPDYVDPESDAGVHGWDDDMWQFKNFYAGGQDADGKNWIIELGLRISNDKWYLIVDGSIDSTGYDTVQQAQMAANVKASALRLRKGEEEAEGVGWLLGGGILIVVLLIVAVYAFAGGKGKSAGKGAVS